MEKTIKFSAYLKNESTAKSTNAQAFSNHNETGVKVISINSKSGMSEREAYQWILSNNKKEY